MGDTTQGLAIVGPGLIGTSIALAAKRRWPDLEIRTVDKGQSLSTIGNALVVVLAAPVSAILDIIPKLPLVISPKALVVDTGSTKHAIMKAACAAKIAHFVGGHPMAGGTSAEDARPDLFDGRPWFLTNPDSPEAISRASRFVEALGAKPVVLSDRGEEHDRLMAAVSHLPQITATMLMAVVARAVGADNLQWSGGGLRDTTRLAASPAEMWQSVLGSNSHELKPLLKYLAAELASFADRLEDPEAVRALFDEANRAKASLQ
jgi:prephenate dehydrogenase